MCLELQAKYLLGPSDGPRAPLSPIPGAPHVIGGFIFLSLSGNFVFPLRFSLYSGDPRIDDLCVSLSPAFPPLGRSESGLIHYSSLSRDINKGRHSLCSWRKPELEASDLTKQFFSFSLSLPNSEEQNRAQ